MKVLIIGLGSMGKRRIRNLQALGVSDIYGFDGHKQTAKEAKKIYGISLVDSLQKSKEQFDLAVISTPPGAHLTAAKWCAKKKIPFFVELNLITKEAYEIQRAAKSAGVQAFFSNTEFFDSDIQHLSGMLNKKFNGYFVFHLGQNIHDWHPWQKPGQHFIFNPKSNGMREMLRIELPWMLKQFGMVTNVAARGKQVYTKKYGVDDLLTVELSFKNGTNGIILLDLISPEVVKRFDAIDKDRVVTWLERENAFVIKKGKMTTRHTVGQKEVAHKYKFHEDAHLEEMRHVLSVLNGKGKSKLRFEDEAIALALIDKIERISKLTK